MVRRRAWIEDHPPQFNTEGKRRAAASIGGRLRPRLSFQLWMIKTFQPEKYKELERRAFEADKSADRAAVAKETEEKRKDFEEVIK